MDKKGQLDFGIISFVGVVVVLLVLAPILVSIVTTIVGETADQINATDSKAGDAMYATKTTFTNLFDFVIILLLGLNLLLLLITSFLVDTHPAFMLFYIMFCFFAIMFIPALTDATTKIYDEYVIHQPEISTYLPLTEFVIDNINYIVLGVMVLSGIIMYAKFKYFSNPI